MDLQVTITANHMGGFIFRLCNLDAADGVLSGGCLDEHRLTRTDNGQDVSWIGSDVYTWTGTYTVPANVSCEHCVLQWVRECMCDWEGDGLLSGSMGTLSLDMGTACSRHPIPLQWYVTGNSCQPPGAPAFATGANMATCGSSPDAYPEEFWNCAVSPSALQGPQSACIAAVKLHLFPPSMFLASNTAAGCCCSRRHSSTACQDASGHAAALAGTAHATALQAWQQSRAV